jgi:hypothetical protein
MDISTEQCSSSSKILGFKGHKLKVMGGFHFSQQFFETFFVAINI